MKKSFLNADDVRKLKYIKVTDPKIKVNHFPDFMIVGPQRTGTTWLTYNILQHPKIFFSNPKEILYFSELESLKNANKVRNIKFKDTFRLKYLRMFKTQGVDSPLYHSRDISWYLSFFYDKPIPYFLKTINAWREYKEIYKPRIRGEGSASYAALDKEIIREIVTINPEIKVILMIRNPIERTWSHAKYNLITMKRKTISDYSDKDFEDYFSRPYTKIAGLYTEMIQKWASLLQKDNLFVGLFDDIRISPKELLLRIYKFIGVDSDPKYIRHDSNAKINKSESIDIPQKYNKMLGEIFADELKRLKENYGLSWE